MQMSIAQVMRWTYLHLQDCKFLKFRRSQSTQVNRVDVRETGFKIISTYHIKIWSLKTYIDYCLCERYCTAVSRREFKDLIYVHVFSSWKEKFIPFSFWRRFKRHKNNVNGRFRYRPFISDHSTLKLKGLNLSSH